MRKVWPHTDELLERKDLIDTLLETWGTSGAPRPRSENHRVQKNTPMAVGGRVGRTGEPAADLRADAEGTTF